MDYWCLGIGGALDYWCLGIGGAWFNVAWYWRSIGLLVPWYLGEMMHLVKSFLEKVAGVQYNINTAPSGVSYPHPCLLVTWYPAPSVGTMCPEQKSEKKTRNNGASTIATMVQVQLQQWCKYNCNNGASNSYFNVK